MKRAILLLVAGISLVACKKQSTQPITTSLSVSGYIKDHNQAAQPAKIDYYLIRAENSADTKTALTVQDSCPKHSIIAFTAGNVYRYKNTVPAGNYILVAQVSYLEEQYNWGRYSYKPITINTGDQLTEKIVFSYEGLSFQYEAWQSQ